MATEILAVGTDAANSSDVVVAAGTPLTVALKDAAAPLGAGARVEIKIKDDDGEYFYVESLISPQKSSLVIYGAGTYRFSRLAGTSCGVFSA